MCFIAFIFLLSILTVSAMDGPADLASSSGSQTVQSVPSYVTDIKSPTLNLHQFVKDIFEAGADDNPSVVLNGHSWRIMNYGQLAIYFVKTERYPNGARLDWDKIPMGLNLFPFITKYDFKDNEWSVISGYTASGKCLRYKHYQFESDVFLDFSFPITLIHACSASEPAPALDVIAPKPNLDVTAPKSSLKKVQEFLSREEILELFAVELRNTADDPASPIFIANDQIVVNAPTIMTFATSPKISSRIQLNAPLTIVVNADVTVTLSGEISGPSALTKDGIGKLVLASTNTYMGGTVIVAGSITVSNHSALGNGSLRVYSGAFLAYAFEHRHIWEPQLLGSITVTNNSALGNGSLRAYSGASIIVGAATHSLSTFGLYDLSVSNQLTPSFSNL